MKHPLLLGASLALTSTLFGAYQPVSDWLKDPPSILPYLVECADFWLPAYDIDHPKGGFISDVSVTGEPSSDYKAPLIQSRNAYAMAKAFMITGDEKYLPYADGALRFLYNYGWDADNGGWWGQLNSEGEVAGPSWTNSNRSSFWQHYQLLGIAALIEATDDPFHRGWLDQGNQINDEKLWDATPGREGYYNTANLNWSNPRDKGFTPTVDAMTTNAVYNYLLTRSDFRKERMQAVANNIRDHLVGNMDRSDVKASFPSEYNTSWQVNTGSNSTSIGHHIKSGWCLSRAYLLTGDPTYLEGATKLLDQVLTYDRDGPNSMWNWTAGVPKGSINWKTGVASGVGDWWTVEQAVTGGLMTWYASGDDSFLQMADTAIDFFMEYYYDYENGEVFSVVNGSGVVTSNTKGQLYKGAYHSVELMYYVYLYGNLFYHKDPVELYYKFEADAEGRDIGLWPMEVEHEKLKITEVTLDGQVFTDYDPDERILSLQPGVGGKFKVKFENTTLPTYPANVWGFKSPKNGRVETAWIGRVLLDKAYYPWTWAEHFGFVYAATPTPNGAWLYRLDTAEWLYTGSELIPYVYSAEAAAWLYLDPTTGAWSIFQGGAWVPRT